MLNEVYRFNNKLRMNKTAEANKREKEEFPFLDFNARYCPLDNKYGQNHFRYSYYLNSNSG